MLSGSMSLLPLTLPVIARVVAEDSSEAFAVGVVDIVVAVAKAVGIIAHV